MGSKRSFDSSFAKNDSCDSVVGDQGISAPVAPAEDEWEGKRIVMKKGKYAGRGAFVKRRVKKKYCVEIDNVPMKLEFYATSFAHYNP